MQKQDIKQTSVGVRDILARIRIRLLEGWQKINFFIFFSYNLPTGTLSSVKKI
jgi:hypothetical protein